MKCGMWFMDQNYQPLWIENWIILFLAININRYSVKPRDWAYIKIIDFYILLKKWVKLLVKIQVKI